MNGPLLDFAQHPVVVRLGWTLLHFLWQALIVAAGLAVTLRFLRQANSRYMAACMALIVLAWLPVATWMRLPGTDPANTTTTAGRADRPLGSNVGLGPIEVPRDGVLHVNTYPHITKPGPTPILLGCSLCGALIKQLFLWSCSCFLGKVAFWLGRHFSNMPSKLPPNFCLTGSCEA